jgi:hypothetical protein
VGDLAADTLVEASGEPGRYGARLSRDWNIWGPNGGDVASLAPRAAGLATGRERPASIVATSSAWPSSTGSTSTSRC